MTSPSRCGHVAILGRPNVGKSTLLNRLVGEKISITTRKPQTTRHHIVGISNLKQHQIIYIDTPGLQQSPKSAINRYMNKQAMNVINDVDVIIFMVEANKWTENDLTVYQAIKNSNAKILLLINKIDRLDDKANLLPYLQELKGVVGDMELIPLSALSDSEVREFELKLVDNLPVADRLYDEDQITNRSMRFIVSELIREKLIQQLGDELPYATAVTIDSYKESEKFTHIHATIWVERPGQKAIVIGKQGAVLKSIGEKARKEIEKMIEHKVLLETWVKQKAKWTDDENMLRQFEFDV